MTGPVLPRNVRRQVLTGRSRGSNDPGSMTIRHREVVTLIDGAINLPARLFTFQPGTMTWLSAFASRFEHYELLSGEIRWTSSNPTTVGGSLAFALDYDVLDTVPDTWVDLVNGSNSVNGAVWDDLRLPIKVQNIVPRRKFCRTGYIAPTLSDSRMYDCFALNFCSTGSPAGYLTIDYVVRFSTPQILHIGSDVADADSVLTSGTTHFPAVNTVKTAVGAGVRIREATPPEGSILSIPSGGAVIETMPNWQGLIELLATNSAANPCSDLNLATATGLYPDADFAPTVTQLETVLEDADGRSKKSYRVKTGSMPGLLRFMATNAAETPLEMFLRSATGAYSSLVL